jgi:hypothetical protein
MQPLFKEITSLLPVKEEEQEEEEREEGEEEEGE